LLTGLDLGRALEQLVGDSVDGLLDTGLQGDRVGTGHHVAQALADQRLSEHGGSGGAVTSDVIGLLGDLLDELGTNLLVGLLEFDLLGDGHAIVGDRRGAPALLQDDVASLRAEGYLHGVGEGVEPALHSATGLLVEGNNLSHWRLDPPVLALARPARRPRRMAVIRGRSRHAPVQRLVSLTTIVTLSARVLTTLLALSPRECKKRFSARRAFRSQGKISRRGALPHAPGASDGSGRSN